MSIVCKLIKSNNLSVDSVHSCLPTLTFVRWRKPRWIPRGPTKEFVLSKKPEVDPEESEWMKGKTNLYRISLKSIKVFLRQTNSRKLRSAKRSKELESEMREQNWQRLMEKNNLWNQKVGELREMEMGIIERKKQEERELTLNRDKEDMERFLQVCENHILKGEYITPENVDQKLHYLLEKQLDYNFAIDRRGNKFLDTSTLPDSMKELLDDNKDPKEEKEDYNG